MALTENDDFADLSNWTTNGSLVDGKLEHHIPVGSSSGTIISSLFNGAKFTGNMPWSISINYDFTIANIVTRGYSPVLASLKLSGGGLSGWHTISIVGADPGDSSGDIRTELFSSRNSAVSQTEWVSNAPLYGTFSISHNGSGGVTFQGAGYITPRFFDGVLDPSALLSIRLNTSITTDTWDEIKVSFDNLSTTGGVDPNPGEPLEPLEPPGDTKTALRAGIGLGARFSGSSTARGVTLKCGLSLAASMTGGIERYTANLIASLGIGAKIHGNQPVNAKMNAGICIRCLMTAETVPASILSAGLALGVKMSAGQSGDSSINGTLFLGCKMAGSSGNSGMIPPCTSPKFSNMNWF